MCCTHAPFTLSQSISNNNDKRWSWVSRETNLKYWTIKLMHYLLNVSLDKLKIQKMRPLSDAALIVNCSFLILVIKITNRPKLHFFTIEISLNVANEYSETDETVLSIMSYKIINRYRPRHTKNCFFFLTLFWIYNSMPYQTD